MKTALTVFDALPDGFLELPANRLHEILPGPSLIHLAGEAPAPLFVSILLHGNETTGFLALQRLLKTCQGASLPRALSIFVGNVAAAAQGLRALPAGADFNRIWPDADGQPAVDAPAAEANLCIEVMRDMRRRRPFASLDLHNTSGRNPHHACITRLDDTDLSLARRFSRHVLYFDRPRGVQNMAFNQICPAMTAECGQAGTTDGIALTTEFLEYCLQTQDVTATTNTGDYELYRSKATVTVADDTSFVFGEGQAQLQFLDGLDGYNWREIPAGTELATQTQGSLPGLQVTGARGEDLTGAYLEIRGRKLVTRCPLVPAMLSLEENIVRQDCLCYFLERVS